MDERAEKFKVFVHLLYNTLVKVCPDWDDSEVESPMKYLLDANRFEGVNLPMSYIKSRIRKVLTGIRLIDQKSYTTLNDTFKGM